MCVSKCFIKMSVNKTVERNKRLRRLKAVTKCSICTAPFTGSRKCRTANDSLSDATAAVIKPNVSASPRGLAALGTANVIRATSI